MTTTSDRVVLSSNSIKLHLLAKLNDWRSLFFYSNYFIIIDYCIDYSIDLTGGQTLALLFYQLGFSYENRQ